MAADANRITLQHFYDWKHGPTVKQVHRKYEEMVEQANANGRHIVQEMQSQGHKDFHSFNKQCPPFELRCNVMELAELGSGMVIYFQFLKLVAVLFILLSLLQVPCMVSYGEHNWLIGWQWNEYTKSYSSTDPCACLGRNPVEGFTGLRFGQSMADYGASCKSWDMSVALKCDAADAVACPGNATLAFCRKWCWAAPHCPAPPVQDDQSRTNVHSRGYVRAYSTCAEELEPECPAYLRDMTSAFNVHGEVEQTDYGYAVGSHWLTPGNFGPYQAEAAQIPVLYLLCVLVTCTVVAVGYQRLVLIDHAVDSKTTSPNDFALMASGLPTTATDETAIMKWFSENSVKLDEVEIVKVVIGWDVEEYRQNMTRLKELRQLVQELPPDDPQVASLKNQMNEIGQSLMSAAPQRASRMQSSGVVVVIFRQERDMRECLRRWRGFWGRTCYSDRADMCCLPPGNRLWKGEELPKFPVGDVPAVKIRVQRAANPGDINWAELGIHWKTKYKRAAKTNAVMGLLILITWLITYCMHLLRKTLEETGDRQEFGSKEAETGFKSFTFAPSLVIAVMNAGIQVAARYLGAYEYHETKTQEQFSTAWKMSAGLTMNVAGALLFLHARPKEWYMHGGLLDNVGMVLLTNTIIPPLIPLAGLKYRLKCWKRRKLTQAKVDHFNEVLLRFPPASPQQKDPAYAKEVKEVKAEIESWKVKAFAPEEMDTPRRYSDVLKVIICTLIFCPVFPLCSFFAVGSVILQFWVDKYLLLRSWKRPDKPMNASMGLFSLRFMKYLAPATFSVTVFIFLAPSWKNKAEVGSMFALSLIASSFFCLVPMSFCAKCLVRCVGGSPVHEGMDYYKAQYMWSKEMKYHKDHFLYAKLPDTVNPEYLKPGTSAAVRLDDIKSGYTQAAAQGAETATYGASVMAQPLLLGGQVLHVAGDPASAGTVDVTSVTVVPAGTGGPAPTTFGVGSTAGSAAGPAPTTYGVGSMAGSVAGHAAAHSVASPPPVPPPKEKPPPERSESVVWEFEMKDHWKPFASDCQEYIEKMFKEFTAGSGKQRFTVNTGRGDSKIKLSIDFRKMTQLKLDTNRTSTIRRSKREHE